MIKKSYAAFAVLFFLVTATSKAEADTVINFGPNGGTPGGDCVCRSLQDGYTAQSSQSISLISVTGCPGAGMLHYTSLFGSENIAFGTNGVNFFSVPAAPANHARVLFCGTPPGTTPFFTLGGGIYYASYVDVPCPNGIISRSINQTIPVAERPAWLAQVTNGSGLERICAP